MRIRVLGTVTVSSDAANTPLTPQLRLLVGLLVTGGGSAVTSDRIGEYLVRDGAAYGSVVRTAVSRLRKSLGGRVETSSGGYRLSVAVEELDASKFLQLCEQARSASPAKRVEVLREALDLWAGRAFGELADEEWARPMGVHLEEARSVAVEDLAEALIGTHQSAQAAVLLRPHLLEQPYRERPVRLVMSALADDGRVADALRAFQRFSATVRGDIGLEPSSELRQLESELLGGLDESRVVAAPAVERLPTGTVTFLFTDIEGSTGRWQADESAMSADLAEHDSTIESVVARHGGRVFKHTGDGLCAVFTSAPSAVDAAIEIQVAVSLPVRIGLHTGEAEQRGGDYFGTTLNRTARVMDAGHGGQILMSSSTVALSPNHATIDHGRLRLKGLSELERVFQVGHAEFPALRVVREIVGNLPEELTSFVGRSAGVNTLVESLIDHRLLTLIGVGGTGKTRLAVETARHLASMFPDGCWLVELAPAAAPDTVSSAFARGLAIRLPQDVAVVDVIVSHLRNKRVLVIVDNCEHVLDAAADVIERIAAECPSASILATSREPLMLNGEHLVPVAPLDHPDAVELFIERAQAEGGDLRLDDTQQSAVEQLCLRLDGLPLALELAASRIRAFSPVELLSMIEERFLLLVGGRRSRMERHRTMRSTLDWSYELCDDAERAVFDHLSVFAATFDLGDARGVASVGDMSEMNVIDAVPRLVDRSLLQRVVASDGTTRYQMLETMRAYGREHVKASDAPDEQWSRYAEYVARTVGQLFVNACGPDEEQNEDRVEEYLSDAWVALDWLTEHRCWNLAARIGGVEWMDIWASDEMSERLNDSLVASGDHPPEASVILREDKRRYQTEPVVALSEIGWRALRSHELVPKDWFARPAVIDARPRTVLEAREVLEVLPRYDRAPLVVRAVAYSAALANIVEQGLQRGVVEEYARAREEFESIEAQLESKQATLWLEALRGDEARAAGCYAAAAQCYGHWAQRIRPSRRGWEYLMANWMSVLAHAMSGNAIELTAVGDLWRFQRQTHQSVLDFRGAIATALALHAVGNEPLALRFYSWVVNEGPDGFTDMFAAEVSRFSDYGTAEPRESEDLDTLIADLQETK